MNWLSKHRKVKECLEFLTCSLINSSKMKGIFVTASVATEKLSEILNSVSVPVVIIGNSIPGVACDRVSTANEEGAYKDYASDSFGT